MSFRLRPSSKKSTDTQNSLVQLPKPQHTFISNEVMSLKQMINKIQMMENNFNILSQGIFSRKYKQDFESKDKQPMLDILKYKKDLMCFSINHLLTKRIFSSCRIQIVQTTIPYLLQSEIPIKIQVQYFLHKQQGKNQLTILKQTLLQQRQSQKQHSKYISQNVQQLSIKQLRLEQQLRQMFNRTRQQYQNRMNYQTNQLQKNDQYKMRKIDNQYQLMKQNMQIMEKRVIEEIQSKIRKQTVIKEYIHQQIDLSKQELLQQQKQLISAEVKLTRQMKQSLQSLYSMINQLKSSFSDQLTETQELTSNNIKRLAMNLDVIDGKYQERIKTVEEEAKQNQQEIVNFRQWVVSKLDQNREIVMGLQQEAVQRMETSQRRGNQDHQQGSQPSSKLQQRFNVMQKDLQSWKSLIQQKNLSIFKQISQSLKQLKLDYKKENDQFSSEIISLTQSLKQLKKSIPNDMKKISQTIVTIFNDQFDVLAQQLDLLTEMIKVSKCEGQKFTKDQIKKHKEQFLQEIKVLISGSKKETNLLLEKSLIKTEQSFKTSLQKESTYLQSLFNQRLQRLEESSQDMQTQSKKLNANTNTQLENFTLSMKQFNQNYKQYLEEQRKQDLKKRIQLQESMRKNATNLMQLAYKKSEFLVQGMKKAMEMNEMKKDLQTKQSLESIRDELAKSNQHNKQELFTQLKSLEQKVASQRQSSEQQLQQTLNQSINTLKRSLNNEIGNNKLQIQQKISNIEREIEEKLAKQKQRAGKTDEKIQHLKKQINDDVSKVKLSQQQQMAKLLQENAKNKQDIAKNKLARDQQISKLNENIAKNKLSQDQQIKKLKDDLAKVKLDQQQQVSKQIKQIQKKIQALHKAINQQTKAQIDVLTEKNSRIQQNYLNLQKSIAILKQEIEQETVQDNKRSQSKLEEVEKQIKQQISKQLASSNQKSQHQIKEHDELINTLRQTVLKLETTNFSQQAKNKAIFDKINEDLNHITINMENISKQIKN